MPPASARTLSAAARTLARTAWLRARLKAIDAGLAAGRRPRQRFVIVGQARSGSQLLRSLLNSHPEVLVFGELLRDPHAPDWSLAGWRSTSKELAEFRADPELFVTQWLERPYPSPITTTGFKLFYDHALSSRAEGCWARLLADPGVRFLHIKRRHLLLGLVSLRQAELTGRWVQTRGASAPAPMVRLTPAECTAHFEQSARDHAAFDGVMPRGRSCEVWYESILEARQAEMRRVQEFLGLPPLTLSTRTMKQGRTSPRDCVENLDDLRRHFEGTRWAALFDE